VVTDSGGIQEEAVSLGKVVLVTRDSTERSEGVITGLLRVVGANSDVIALELAKLAREREDQLGPFSTFGSSPYGDGKASERIASVLAGEFTDEFEPLSGGLGQGASERDN
jgi:UDP-N-acetylglucosamine 2-epimerase (non-hydrolysing)